MRYKRILFALFLLGVSVIIAIGYPQLLVALISSKAMSWTIGSVFARLLVLIAFFGFLKVLFPLLFPKRKSHSILLFLIALLPSLALSFIHPIYTTDYGSLDDSFIFKGLDFLENDLNSPYTFKGEPVVLAFFTTDCNHCKAVCSKLAINAQSGQQLPVHAFFSGASEDAYTFLADNNALDFEYHFIEEDSVYLTYSGYIFPSIFLLDEKGNTTKHWEGDVVNYTALDYLRSY